MHHCSTVAHPGFRVRLVRGTEGQDVVVSMAVGTGRMSCAVEFSEHLSAWDMEGTNQCEEHTWWTPLLVVRVR